MGQDAQENGVAEGVKMKAVVGFFMTLTGGIVAGINLAIMFPNPEYTASWHKVICAIALAVVGGMMMTERSKP
jgi:putative Mn2+ efflux pump MntP